MARKKSGLDISGWVLIDKEPGVTSNAVSNKVRWLFNARKAGHAGTLDPDATGLLAVALGEATKTIPYVTDTLKEYSFIVKFGEETSTDDTEGDVLKTSQLRPTNEEIKATLKNFIGEVEQVPPKFSAVKINGNRAYKLARDKADVIIAPKLVQIDTLELTSRTDINYASFKMVCGKGGYVRAIARDIGRVLGCYGHTQSLRRHWSGIFDIRDASKLGELEALKGSPKINDFLIPTESSLANIDEIPVTLSVAKKIQHGNSCYIGETTNPNVKVAWVSYQKNVLALGECVKGEFFPFRVFVNSLIVD